jgi:hypothetical protein
MIVLAAAVLAALIGVSANVRSNLRRFGPAPPARAVDPALVSILIPARDERDGIESAVRAACGQRGARVETIVLDDGSTDGTGEILARLDAELPALRVVRGAPPPRGWAGKSWACWQLAMAHARGDWLLFVDADVRLAPEAAARAVALARAETVDFASAFPRQITATAGEAVLVPLIYLVLLSYLPMRLVRTHPLPSLSAGCGQLMLARRDAYLAAGGHRAVRGTLHDGLLLARRMKATGHAIAVFDGADIAACRMYHGFRSAWRGFARNAYEALGSPAALLAMTALNAGLFVLPFAALPMSIATQGLGVASAIWGASVAIALGIRTRLAVRFGAPAWTVIATPVAVLAMIGVQWTSFVNHIARRPVIWRGRAYPGDRTRGDVST